MWQRQFRVLCKALLNSSQLAKHEGDTRYFRTELTVDLDIIFVYLKLLHISSLGVQYHMQMDLSDEVCA